VYAASVLAHPRPAALLAQRAMFWAVASPAIGSACVSPGLPPQRQPQPAQVEIPATAPTILSAHASRLADHPADHADHPALGPAILEPAPEPRDGDRLVLVFSEQVDPLTLDPRGFAISRADGRRVLARSARLAPANEGDEHRSVTLVAGPGEFGTLGSAPVAVHVIGKLFTESGRALQGLDAEISDSLQPDRPVAVEQLAPGPASCPGAEQALRTYWSDDLGAIEAGDLSGVELRFANGEVLHPTAFDDHTTTIDDHTTAGAAAPPAPEDNVLDLCTSSRQTLIEVRFAAGVFTDLDGHPSGAAALSISTPGQG